MAVKFPLKMSGVEVRTLEDLRKHFDLTAVVEYYKSGKLLKWLEDRYYEEEAEKIEGLDSNTSDFNRQLCDALGVEYNESNDERLQEKRKFLETQTKDSSIINNADKTALNQEDLADLLDAGRSVIYLYGGNTFSIPMRKTGKRYIGILGIPNIMIAAKSQAEVDSKNISFENCNLPWTNTNNFTKKEYQSTARTDSTSRRSSVNNELDTLCKAMLGPILGLVDKHRQ